MFVEPHVEREPAVAEASAAGNLVGLMVGVRYAGDLVAPVLFAFRFHEPRRQHGETVVLVATAPRRQEPVGRRQGQHIVGVDKRFGLGLGT